MIKHLLDPWASRDAVMSGRLHDPMMTFPARYPKRECKPPQVTFNTNQLVDNVIADRTMLAHRLSSSIVADLEDIITNVGLEIHPGDYPSLEKYADDLIKVAIHETLHVLEDHAVIHARHRGTHGEQVTVRLNNLSRDYWAAVNT